MELVELLGIVVGIVVGIIVIVGVIVSVTKQITRRENRIKGLEKQYAGLEENYRDRMRNHEDTIESLKKRCTELEANYKERRPQVAEKGIEDTLPQWGKEIEIPGTKEKVGTGWLRSTPDPHDYTEDDHYISAMASKLNISPTQKALTLPKQVDLRRWFLEIKHQGRLNSSTAHAAVAIVEYFERRAFNRTIDPSRLFVYKNTRTLMNRTGDTGADLRSTLRAIVRYGIPPEMQWPYTDKKPDFDKEPPAFTYASADSYWAIRYFRHDPVGIPLDTVLVNVKKSLVAGIPSMFGFFGYPSFSRSNIEGGIPYPCRGEEAQWRHAVVAVGYDDNIKIMNLQCDKETTGALLIRNSWGISWGDGGYGWLPYEYVLNELALDFWSMLRLEWVDTERFGI